MAKKKYAHAGRPRLGKRSLNFTMAPEVHATLKAFAHVAGVSLGSIVERALKALFGFELAKHPKAAQIRGLAKTYQEQKKAGGA